MTTPETPETEYEKACRVDYEAACKKGRLLLQRLKASINELGELLEGTGIPAESKYLNYTALKENKWFEFPSADYFQALDRLSKNLGIDTSHNIFISHHHKMLNVLHPEFPEQVHFDSVINSSAGMLAAMYTQSPMDSFRKQKAVLDAEPKHISKDVDWTEVGNDFPSLKHWSDVAYLQWAKNVKSPSDLRCVLRISIKNPKTKAVVQHIMKDFPVNGDKLQSFRTDNDSDHVAALLGTPNGVGVAWLLIQHKQQLGHKTVEKVTVDCHDKSTMGDDGTIDPSLVFHLRDVVAPGAGSEDVVEGSRYERKVSADRAICRATRTMR